MMTKDKETSQPKKVLLGLSGGVDSTASAALLKAQGFEVSAVTLDTWQEGETDRQRLERAAHSAALLGIPHHLRCGRRFRQGGLSFVNDWRAGLTQPLCHV